jgi:YidC/Oxa1 family membrane protein insertase
VLNWFYEAVANAILGLHHVLSPVFGTDSAWTWALSIVLLVVAIRILLFPLFVKQIKTQRVMMELQPKIKALQQKYRGDRETLNTELMKLYREHNANPLGGCLPLLIQMPIFIALFRVLNSFKPHTGSTGPGCPTNFSDHYGINCHLVKSAASAKVLGAPIASSFRSSATTLAHLEAHVATVRIVTVAMIVLMTATTFLTQRQLMSRNAAQAGTSMAQQQKILLYVLPLSFAIFGINFPVGVLLYWLTTNLWSMGQQFLVINRMNLAPAGAGAGAAPAPAAGLQPSGRNSRTADAPAGDGSADSPKPESVRPTPPRPPNRNRNRSKKRNRRGGRR